MSAIATVSAHPIAARAPRVAYDLLALSKPRILLMTLLTAGWGLGLAPSPPSLSTIVWCLIGTGLSVGSANAFNMWMEQDVDARMERTRSRPLPQGRLRARSAFVFALGTGIASVPVLALCVNTTTAALSVVAHLTYVLAYTPLKRVSTVALPVGAFAGAMPPLLGWTAATNALGAPGLVLFGILFVWQIPHFIAIALFRKHDYANAGLKTVPGVFGDRTAAWLTALSTVALLAVSLALPATGAAGLLYTFAALVAGGSLVVMSLRGLARNPRPLWTRTYFLGTLAYLPGLAAGMLLDMTLLTRL